MGPGNEARDNLLQGGSLYFEAECPEPTVYFKVKCPEGGGGLLRSNLPPGHFTSGGKLLSDIFFYKEGVK